MLDLSLSKLDLVIFFLSCQVGKCDSISRGCWPWSSVVATWCFSNIREHISSSAHQPAGKTTVGANWFKTYINTWELLSQALVDLAALAGPYRFHRVVDVSFALQGLYVFTQTFRVNKVFADRTLHLQIELVVFISVANEARLIGIPEHSEETLANWLCHYVISLAFYSCLFILLTQLF